MKFTCLTVFILISTVACSNKGIYDHFQYENRKNCKKLPETQYDECIKRASKSYKEYEKERKQLN